MSKIFPVNRDDVLKYVETHDKAVRQKAWMPERPLTPDLEIALGSLNDWISLKHHRIDAIADASDVNLANEDLTNANFSGSILRHANLEAAILHETILRGTDLTGANLDWTNLTGAKLVGTLLNNASANDVVLNNTLIDGVMAANLTTNNHGFRHLINQPATEEGLRVQIERVFADPQVAEATDQALLEGPSLAARIAKAHRAGDAAQVDALLDQMNGAKHTARAVESKKPGAGRSLP